MSIDEPRVLTWSLCLAWTLLVPVTAPANGGQPATGNSPSTSQSLLDKIPRRMNQFVTSKRISGAVTLVYSHGRIVHLAATGFADLETHRPMQKDTMFSIASMTKPITATALMILQDEGKLSVDDPVSKYLPEFSKVRLHNGQPPHRPLTVRDLMTHTSGLGGSQQNHGSLKETIEQLAMRRLEFQPGAKWQYSPGMSVCGRIIEVASGQPYDQFLEQHIFHPLEMLDTTFFPNVEQKKRLARLYKPGDEENSIVPATSWISELSAHRTPNPSAGLFSTASDLAKFYQMILAGGQLHGQRIISSKAVEQMTSIQTGALKTGFTPGNGWGLGWCVVSKPQGVTTMLSPGTCGHGGAFGTQGWIDLQRKMIFVLMIQRTGFPKNSDSSDIRGEFQQLAVDATAATDSP